MSSRPKGLAEWSRGGVWWGVVGCGVAGVKRLRAPPQGTPTLNSSTRVANALNEQSIPASQANSLAVLATRPPLQRRYKPCPYKPPAQARALPPSTALQAAPRRHIPPQTPPPKSAPTPSPTGSQIRAEGCRVSRHPRKTIHQPPHAKDVQPKAQNARLPGQFIGLAR